MHCRNKSVIAFASLHIKMNLINCTVKAIERLSFSALHHLCYCILYFVHQPASQPATNARGYQPASQQVVFDCDENENCAHNTKANAMQTQWSIWIVYSYRYYIWTGSIWSAKVICTFRTGELSRIWKCLMTDFIRIFIEFLSSPT